MGWNIHLAVIESTSADEVIQALKLPVADPEDLASLGPATLSTALQGDVWEEYWGIGRVGDFTVAATRFVEEKSAVWRKLSRQRRIVVIRLSENHGSNALEIYEGGKRVLSREEKGTRPWPVEHRLEKGARSAHPADHLCKVFRNLVGRDLMTSDVLDVPVQLRPVVKAEAAPTPAADPAALAKAEERLTRALSTTLPDLSKGYAVVDWGMALLAFREELGTVWAADREAVEKRWLPQALQFLEPYPRWLRRIDADEFESIGRGTDDERFAMMAPLFRVLDMDFRPGYGLRFQPKIFQRFFAHPIVRQLEVLSLAGTRLPREMALLLARAPTLERIEALHFGGCDFDDAAVLALLRVPSLGSLRALDVSSCGLTGEGFATLLREPRLKELTALDVSLGHTDFPPDDGAALTNAFATAGPFPELRHLNVSSRTLEVTLLRALLDHGCFPALERLKVESLAIDPSTTAGLARPGLRVVNRTRAIPEYNPEPDDVGVPPRW